MRRFAMPLFGVAALLLVAVALVAGWRLGNESRPEAAQRLEDIEARQQEADESALSLVETLGPFCSGYDFYYKQDMARGAFRPVRCSSNGGENTVLFAYGFDSTRTQDAWVGEWDQHIERRGATLLEADMWAVEVLDPGILDDVRSLVQASP